MLQQGCSNFHSHRTVKKGQENFYTRWYYVAGIGATESSRMNEENEVHDAASHLRLLSILPPLAAKVSFCIWQRGTQGWLGKKGQSCPLRKLKADKHTWCQKWFPPLGLYILLTMTPVAWEQRGGELSGEGPRLVKKRGEIQPWESEWARDPRMSELEGTSDITGSRPFHVEEEGSTGGKGEDRLETDGLCFSGTHSPTCGLKTHEMLTRRKRKEQWTVLP